MLITFVLSLIVAVALVQQPADAVTYDRAIVKLNELLTSHVSGDSLEEYSAYLEELKESSKLLTRQNADLYMDSALADLVYHLGRLASGYKSHCMIRPLDSLEKVDYILNKKPCKPSLIGGNRLEIFAHQVCRKWAQECWSSLKSEYVNAYSRVPRESRIKSHLRIFLEDANSQIPESLTAKRKLVEKNMKSPDLGRLLTIAMYNQVDFDYRSAEMQKIDPVNLEKKFDRYFISPCRNILKETAKPTGAAKLFLLALAPSEVPADNDALLLYDALSINYVCRNIIDKKANYIEKIQQTLKSALE